MAVEEPPPAEELPDLNDAMKQGGAEATGGPTEGGTEEEMPDLSDPDVNAAATKIQAVQKGRRARADVATLRASQELDASQEAAAAEGPVDNSSALVAQPEEEKLELVAGLDPTQIAQLFFLAVQNQDYDTWLHCLHMETRSHPSSREPGPFWCQSWEALRGSVRKHSATYRLETKDPDMTQKFLTLKFAPLYGDVPGYAEGERLSSKNIVLDMEKEETEWRVQSISYEEE
eukprot:jgi/Tetstr1/459340/TSEL_004735.t1